MSEVKIILLLLLIIFIAYLLNKNEYINQIKKVGNMEKCDYVDNNIEYKCEDSYKCVQVKLSKLFARLGQN